MRDRRPIALNQPVLRWAARARTIPDIEKELARIWAKQDLTTEVDGQPGRHIAARTNVMNLVVSPAGPRSRNGELPRSRR